MSGLNAKIIGTLRERLELGFEKAVADLDKDINALKVRKSANGGFFSGATPQGVCNLCKSTLDGSTENFQIEVRNAVDNEILVYEVGLSATLHNIFAETVPASLEFAVERLESIVNLVCRDDPKAPELYNKLRAETADHYQVVSQKLLTEIKLSVASLQAVEKKNAESAKQAKWHKIGIVVGILMPVVAGLWTFFLWYSGTLPLTDLSDAERSEQSRGFSQIGESSENTNRAVFECDRQLNVSLGKATQLLDSGNIEKEYLEGSCITNPGWLAETNTGVATDSKTGVRFVRLTFIPENIIGKLYFQGASPELARGARLKVIGRISTFRPATVGRNPKTGERINIPTSLVIVGIAREISD